MSGWLLLCQGSGCSLQEAVWSTRLGQRPLILATHKSICLSRLKGRCQRWQLAKYGPRSLASLLLQEPIEENGAASSWQQASYQSGERRVDLAVNIGVAILSSTTAHACSLLPYTVRPNLPGVFVRKLHRDKGQTGGWLDNVARL